MSNYSCQEEKPGELALSGELTIYDATELKGLLLDKLNSGSGLSIDLSGVTDLDCAGIQVMLLLHREAKNASKPLKWLKHSEAVNKVLEFLNLGSTLGEPVSLVWS
jgi:anti-sigma B factor antagonist